ncbi:MAG: hypothetical protein GXY41_09955 [Phycisphaerae bacterium]|nr:hypothetical protein [Phycisphaerae bacterium]
MAQKRNQRALNIIRVLKSRQRNQAKKIDILCRDMVAAHEHFSHNLSRLSFAVSFYETLLKCGGLEEALDCAVMLIRKHIHQASAAVFWVDSTGFDVHLAKSPDLGQVEKAHFQSWFSRQMVQQIGQTNRISSLEDMLQMGLMAPPSAIRTLSAAAVPLGRLGQGVGFILVYRAAERPLLAEELSRIAAIAPGLRETILSFKPDIAKSPQTAS